MSPRCLANFLKLSPEVGVLSSQAQCKITCILYLAAWQHLPFQQNRKYNPQLWHFGNDKWSLLEFQCQENNVNKQMTS